MDSSLDVVGIGTASGAPDAVLLDVRVSVDGAGVATSLSESSRLMRAVHQAAAAAGVDQRQIRTTGASVHQRWAPDGSGPDGYTAVQSARLRVGALDAVGTVVSACADVAGDHFGLDGLALVVSDDQPLLTRARELAFADARRKADQYAHLARRAVGRVVSVSEPGAAVAFEPRQSAKAREMSLAGAADVPVAAGESSVTVSVAVRFAWAD